MSAHARMALAAAALLLATVLAMTLAGTAFAGKANDDLPPDCADSARVAKGAFGAPLRGICDYLDERAGVVQVALFDAKSGRTYELWERRATQYTASIVKVDILARWLRQYQQRDVEIPDEIPYSIKYLMGRMIQNSDNAAATSLFYFGGGCDALNRFNRLIPLKTTDVACESKSYYGWGNTTTTAADQVKLMREFAYGGPPPVLRGDARRYGNQLMEGVEPDQRFGITCGPWGAACDPPNYAQPVVGVDVALKNGWKTLPTCTDPIPQCPWQVNSTGWVEGSGRSYVLSVLTTRDPVGTGDLYGFSYGIETIQGVSRIIWDNLG